MGTGNPHSAAGYARWEGVSEDERYAALQHVRDGRLAKARVEALAQAEVLGVTLTPEQADAAAAHIFHEKRVAHARWMAAQAHQKAQAARKAAAK